MAKNHLLNILLNTGAFCRFAFFPGKNLAHANPVSDTFLCDARIILLLSYIEVTLVKSSTNQNVKKQKKIFGISGKISTFVQINISYEEILKKRAIRLGILHVKMSLKNTAFAPLLNRESSGQGE